jgi:hypothetical protein
MRIRREQGIQETPETGVLSVNREVTSLLHRRMASLLPPIDFGKKGAFSWKNTLLKGEKRFLYYGQSESRRPMRGRVRFYSTVVLHRERKRFPPSRVESITYANLPNFASCRIEHCPEGCAGNWTFFSGVPRRSAGGVLETRWGSAGP